MSLLQPNFFQFPNVIADELMRHLTPAEFICLVVIIRKTRGWHKASDAISLSQFREMTGIKSNRTIMRALHRLCSDEVGLVKAIKAPKKTTVYRLGEVFFAKKCTRSSIAKIAQALDAQKTPASQIPIAINAHTKDIYINTGEKNENAHMREVKPDSPPGAPPTRQPPEKPELAKPTRAVSIVGEELNPETEQLIEQLREACKP